MLTEQHSANRLQWADEHKDFDWDRVIFTDDRHSMSTCPLQSYDDDVERKKWPAQSNIRAKSTFGVVCARKILLLVQAKPKCQFDVQHL